MNLGNKLITLRKQNKLTQEQLAEKLKVSRQTISNWELNQTKPDIDQIKALSKFYNMSVDELIDNDIKELLTEKVSSVEKLTGRNTKTLKWVLIFSIVALAVILWFIISLSSYAWFIGSYHEYECEMNGEKFYVEIKPDSNEKKLNYKETLITEGDVIDVIIDPYISIPGLEKYKKVYQVRNLIFNHFESNGGKCKQYISASN